MITTLRCRLLGHDWERVIPSHASPGGIADATRCRHAVPGDRRAHAGASGNADDHTAMCAALAGRPHLSSARGRTRCVA